MPTLPATHDHAHPPIAAAPGAPRVRRSWLQAGAGWRIAAVAAVLTALALVVYGSLAR